jgi:hypothetical protein
MKLQMPKAKYIVLGSAAALAGGILLSNITSLIVASRSNPQPVAQASSQATADQERIQKLEGQIAELTSRLAQQPSSSATPTTALSSAVSAPPPTLAPVVAPPPVVPTTASVQPKPAVGQSKMATVRQDQKPTNVQPLYPPHWEEPTGRFEQMAAQSRAAAERRAALESARCSRPSGMSFEEAARCSQAQANANGGGMSFDEMARQIMRQADDRDPQVRDQLFRRQLGQ